MRLITNASDSPGSGQTLQVLQAGRAIAAIMVVIYHIDVYIWSIPKYFPHEFWHPFSTFRSGVQFFFVLSGFIIFFVHRKDLDQPAKLRPFALKRFNRVYLPYWCLLGFMVPWAFLVPTYGSGYETQWSPLLSSIFLLPHSQTPLLGIAWTLKHEVLFYAIFAIAILNLRFGLVLLIAWQSSCVIALLTPDLPFPLSFVFSPNNLLFTLGMAAAVIATKRSTRSPAFIAGAGAAVFFITGVHEIAENTLSYGVYVLGYGVGSALMVVGFSELEYLKRVRVPGCLIFLGDASYSIYLVHLAALWLCAKVLFILIPKTLFPEAITFVILLCGATLIGIAFHLIVEKPLLRIARQRFPHRSLRPPVESTA